MTQPLLTYGLSPEGLKNILEVDNGLACNCVCPKCKDPLVAKNKESNKKAPHFAHSADNDCVGAYETALHILAKEVLAETRKIRVPDFFYENDSNIIDSFFEEGRIVQFEKISIEEKISEANFNAVVIADAVGYVSDRKVIIEFAVTHFIDSEKHKKLEGLNIPCIEINLKNQTLDRKALQEFMLDVSNEISWIINPKLKEKALICFEQRRIKKQKEQEERDKAERLEKEIAKQRNIELLFLSQEKYEKYRQETENRFLKIVNGIVRKCPIVKREIGLLKSTRFYQHSVLKAIIDGEYWNGKIYGRFSKKFFFRNEEKIIFPFGAKRHEMGDAEVREAKFLYSGLMTISEIIENSVACSFCKFYADTIIINKDSHIVCQYSKQIDC